MCDSRDTLAVRVTSRDLALWRRAAGVQCETVGRAAALAPLDSGDSKCHVPLSLHCLLI